MRSLNQLTLVGRVGNVKDLSGTAKVSIATDRSYKDGDEWKKVTDWVEVTAFGRNAEFINAELGKGDLVLVKARVANRSYEKNGETVYTTDVIAESFDQLARKQEEEGA